MYKSFGSRGGCCVDVLVLVGGLGFMRAVGAWGGRLGGLGMGDGGWGMVMVVMLGRLEGCGT